MPPGVPAFQDFVGAEFVELNDDGATMRMEIRADHLDADGAVHQAVIFTLADSVLGQGIFKLLRKPCTTAEIKINYLRPATGRFLTAHSRIVRAGARLVVARADVHDSEGQIAEALSTFAMGIIQTFTQPVLHHSWNVAGAVHRCPIAPACA